MALSDLAVYSEFAYEMATEVLDQQIAVFNEASDGTIILTPSAHQGDFSEEAFFAKIDGLIRRRDPYSDAAITSKSLKHIRDVSVKVATGTPEIRMDKGQFRWIQRNPEEAGVILGRQLAGDMLGDMVNTAIGIGVSAISNDASNIRDVSTTSEASFVELVKAAGLLGDRQSAIRAWVMHSAAMTQLYVNAITNANSLFNYGTVNVLTDPMGRRFIVTDSPSLAGSAGFNTLGLQQGAILVGQNNDFDANESSSNGHENIQRSYQAEWSYNVGIKGYAWDSANGGKAPTDASLFTATNWDKYSTSHKDLAGVLLKTK